MDEIKKEMNENSQESTLGTELQSCQEELKLMKERYLYLNAEFDNYKKRMEKERVACMEYSQDVTILDFLNIYDDMERALSEVGKLPQEAASHLAGFELIAKAFQKLLKKYEVEEITHLTEFNPEQAEAIMQVASPEHQSGEIVSVLQKAYCRKGRILRPAKVSVAQ